MTKFDDALLITSGACLAGYGGTCLAAPDVAAKVFYSDAKNAKHVDTTSIRWIGSGFGAASGLNIGLACEEVKHETKKNAMKTMGVFWGVVAAQNAYGMMNKEHRQETAIGNIALAAGLSGTMLWRGFKKD